MKKYIITILCLLAFKIYGQDFTKIDLLIDKSVNVDEPGVSVVLINENGTFYKKAKGKANLEYQVDISTSTLFGIGSVTKQFTGYAVLMLEQQGKLSLNDYTNKYLPDLPEYASKITIVHLLKHMSGLREQENLFAITGISTADIIENYNVLELLKRQIDLNFEPGDELEYSNTGYIILASIIEKVTGVSYREWMEQNIFNPLGMNNTFVHDDVQEVIFNKAYPYFLISENKYGKGIYNLGLTGSTGIFTNAIDIEKWVVNYINPKVGSQKIVNRMLNDTDTLNNGELIDYSYGIAVTDYRGSHVCFHGGSEAGYRSFLLIFPAFNTGIVVLSNNYNINVRQLSFDIVDILFENKLGQAVEKEVENFNKEKETKKEIVIETSKYLGEYYSGELETIYEVRRKDESLCISHVRNGDISITPLSENVFNGAYPIGKIKFDLGPNGVVQGFYLTNGRARNLYFKKM